MVSGVQKVLILDDEEDIVDTLDTYVSHLGAIPVGTTNWRDAEAALEKGDIDVVISDNHMPEKPGIALLEEWYHKYKLKGWIMITADRSPELIEKAASIAPIEVLSKPFQLAHIESAMERVTHRELDPLQEIVQIVGNISGVRLDETKQNLVKTRIGRRVRELGLNNTDEYLVYFKDNRSTEVNQMISNLTTHTTEFFREADHFTYLLKEVFPAMRERKQPIRIWSAACSSGEEAYSLAICFLEWAKENNVLRSEIPGFEIVGTDIDFASVEKAQQGIYPRDSIKGLSPKLVREYFDVGSGELEGLVRVKDEIHSLCSFKQNNLQSRTYNVEKFDIVFLRNVLIYFSKEDIESIAQKIKPHLRSQGYLFLGHSESIADLEVPYDQVGNAIYRPRAKKRTEEEDSSKVVPLRAGQETVKVLIVDDSLTIRKKLRKLISGDPKLEVVGDVGNPLEAEKFLESHEVDVMTLDINMPEMDGITYLRQISEQKLKRPPILIISEVKQDQAKEIFAIEDISIIDFIQKPEGGQDSSYSSKVTMGLKVAKKRRRKTLAQSLGEILYTPSPKDLLVLGASTGGVEALCEVLKQVPHNSPPILIVQHMPPNFTAAFASRLNGVSQVSVVEASDRMEVLPGQAYVAPGGIHMGVKLREKTLRIELNKSDKVNRFRPSVDYLYQSVLQVVPKYKVSAALLTGMGVDGARGLLDLKEAGVHTVAQDEETSVVFGMPGEAVALGAAVKVLPIHRITQELFKGLKRKNRREAA